MSTKEKELIASEAAKNRPNITKSAQRICKLRVYTEFAKHGTLRSFQTREIPKRFGKNYLHELTARALMREVLLGLLQMHESFALLYDLNASNVYVSHPMQAVYKTLFPAYISDIPVGSLFKVNMKYLGNLLLEQQQSKLVKGQRTEKRGRLARDAHHMKNRSEIAVAPLNRSSLGSDLPAKEDHAHKVANNNNNNIANADAVQEQQYVNKDTLLANGQVAESGKENTLGLTENLNLSARQTHELSTAVLDAKNSTVFTSNTELIESNSLMYVNIDDINNDATNVDNNNIKEDDLVSENTVLNEDDDVFWQSAHARKYFTEHGYESDSLFAPSMNNSWPSVTSETKSKQRVSRSAKKGDKKYDRNLHWRAILTHNDHEKVISLKPNDMPLQYSLEELISPSLSPRSKKRFPFSIPRRKKKSKVQKALTNLEHANNVNKTFKPNENPLQGVVFIASQRLPSYFVERPDTTNKANNELSSTLRNNTIKTGKGKATLKSEAQRSDVTHKSTDKQINVNKIALVGGTSSDAATAHKSLNEHQCSKTTTTTTITHNKNDNNNNFKKCESSSYRPHCSLQESCALMETSAEYSTQQYSRRGSKSENCTSLGISRCNELCSLPSYLPLLLEDSTAEANTQKSIVAGKLVQNIIEASKVSTVTGKADALHLGTHPQHLQTHQNEPKREDIQLPMHIREKENVNKSNKHKNKAEVNNAQVTMANLSAPANTAERNNTITSPVEDVLEPSTSEFQFNESIIQGTWRANEHSNSNSSNVHYRHRHPVVKLNYTTLLKRVLARKQNQSDSKTVPLHRFMRITHAAPEVILNRQFSQASDVYAFAMMFIELCTPNGEILPECEPNVNVASPSHTHHTPEVDELVIAGTQNDKEEDQEGKQHQYYNKEQQQHLHMSNINPPNEYVERKEYEEQRAANVKAWYKSQLEQYNKRQKRSMENSSPVYSAMKENNYDSNAIINKIHATKANSTEVAATVAAAPSGIASVLIRPNDSITARGVFASRNTIRKEDAFGTNFDLSAYIVDPDSQNKHSAVNNSNTSNDLFNNNCSSSNYNMYDKSFYSTELNKRGSGASFAGNIDDLFDLDYMQHCLVPIPSHLSSECKRLLARCLHVNPAKRPSVAELLRSPYFLFGHWIQHSAHDIKEYHAKALHDARNELTPELFDEEREHGTQTLSLSLSTEHALHNNSQAKPENMNCIVATSNGNKKNNVIIGERNQNRQTRNAQNDNNNYKSASQIHTVSWVNAPEELDYRRMPEVP